MRVTLTKDPASHSFYAELVKHPPSGVSYAWQTAAPQSGSRRHSSATRLLRWLHLPNVLPFGGRSADDELVHSCQALLLTSRRWVVDIEHASPFVGTSFDRGRDVIVRRVIRSILTRPGCKAILPWTETAASGFLRQWGHVEEIRRRVRVVHPATGVAEPVSRPGRVSRLLFVANRPDWNFVIKGGRELLAAFAALRGRHPGLRLSIVGPRPASLAGDADAPGVEWHGIVDRATLQALYRDADVYVMPSYSDTFGLVYLEAMANGVPVVALRRPYTRDIVTHEQTGLLVPVPPGSFEWCTEDGAFTMNSDAFIDRMQAARADDAIVQGLVEALDRLIDDVGLARRLGDQAREEIATGRFAVARRNAALSEVYARALEGGGR